MLLSVLVICSNLAFVYAEDEIENIEEPQIEEVKKEEPQVEEVKKEEPQKEEVKKEEVKEEVNKVEEVKTEVKNEVVVEQKALTTTTTKNNTTDDSWTIHVDNVLNTKANGVNGHAVAYDNTQTKSQPSGQNIINPKNNTPYAGPLAWAGGKNQTANGIGYTYKFQNAYVLSKEGDEPYITEDVTNEIKVTKLQYKGNNELIVTLSDGSTTTIDSNEVYISPIYTAQANWYLNYKYIDNISTGSGSWSNADAITQYKHTFTNPETKSPSLTDGLYQFKYWENEETGTQYEDGDEFVYGGAELTIGETKNVNVYAYWQPAVQVKLHNGAEIVKTITSFNSIDSADFEKLADTDTKKFLGWFDENGQLADIYNAPTITKKADSVLIIDLFAKFKEIIQPTDDPTDPVDPVDPTDNPKPQPKKTQPQVQPIPQTEEVVIASTNPPTTTIDPAPTPKAEPEGSWALINLIAAILSCICALVLLFVRKDTEDDEPTDDEKKDMRKMILTKIASAIIGIGSIIIFILTEDMSLPMVLTDKWTFLMILLLIIEIVNIFIIRQQSKGEENDDNN